MAKNSSKRDSTKRALRNFNVQSTMTDRLVPTKQDTMRAGRRNYKQGKGK